MIPALFFFEVLKPSEPDFEATKFKSMLAKMTRCRSKSISAIGELNYWQQPRNVAIASLNNNLI